MAKIAISYRRSDAAAEARLLYDRLSAHYGPTYGDNAVYMDVLKGRRGKNYKTQFNGALKHCVVMLAVMGPDWFGGTTPKHTKITDANDPIRLELETATDLDIEILPVLIDDAAMVNASKLPQKLQYLTEINAAEIHVGRDFDLHVGHLIRDIDALLREAGEQITNAVNDVVEEQKDRKPDAPVKAVAPRRTRSHIATILHVSRSWFVRPVPLASLAVCLGVVAAAWAFIPPKSFKLAWATDQPPPSTEGKLPGPRPGAVDHIGDAGNSLIVRPLLKDALELRSIAFSPAEPKRMAVAGDDGFIRVWNMETLLPEHRIRARELVHEPPVTGVHKIAFSALGDLIYSAGLDNKIEVFNWSKGEHIGALEAEPSSNVAIFLSVAAFPRKESMNRWIAAGADDGCFRIWHVDKPNDPIVSKYVNGGAGRLNAKCVQPVKLEKGNEIQAIAYAPEGRGPYAVGSRDGTIFLFSEQREPRSVRAHRGPVAHIEFSPDGESLASAGADGDIHIWKFADVSKPYKTLTGHSNAISSLAWSGDGRWLISGSEDKTVRLWDTSTWRQAGAPFTGHRKDVSAVAFDPKHNWIISGSQDGMLKIWSMNSREAVVTLIAYTDGSYIAYHRNGIFTGSADPQRHIMVSYLDGSSERALLDHEKKALYVAPEAFVMRLRSGM